MSTSILLPTALRQFTDGLSEVQVEGKTVGEALTALTTRYVDLQRHLFADDRKLRSFVNVFINDEDIRRKDGLNTAIKDGDVLMLVPSIAGGFDDHADSIQPELTRKEIERYSRHLILPEVGFEGQIMLKRARVLIVGTGGLGAPLAMYLAAAGIGTIGIVDFDFVDESNLQRQIIHGTRDIGRPKTASALDRIKAINPNVKVITFNEKLSSDNALDIIKDFDIVADGTDNFQTRYLINDACVFLGKPNVYGSIYRFEGQASVFCTKPGPCYRCLYPEPPPPGLVPSCAEGGVLGVLPGIIGCIQANETIKLILGGGDSLANRLLIFDAWKMKFRELKLIKDSNCPVCGTHPTIKELIDYEEFCGIRKHSLEEDNVEEISAADLKRRLDNNDDILVVDVREPHEYAIAKLPNSKVIPFGQMVRRQGELDPKRDTVVVCKVGNRSALAIKALHDSGYNGRLLNLKDGIVAWANNVDRNMARY
jgi:sulfur-carrier protein adenylyltransferase/sulfurtransferase